MVEHYHSILLLCDITRSAKNGHSMMSNNIFIGGKENDYCTEIY